MASQALRWDDSLSGPIGLEAIQALHQPSERYRISPGRYPAGTEFIGAARARRVYLLGGACAFAIGSSSWELRAGDITDLPAGEYQFRVLGSGPVELVRVWELPPEFWGRTKAEHAAHLPWLPVAPDPPEPE